MFQEWKKCPEIITALPTMHAAAENYKRFAHVLSTNLSWWFRVNVKGCTMMGGFELGFRGKSPFKLRLNDINLVVSNECSWREDWRTSSQQRPMIRKLRCGCLTENQTHSTSQKPRHERRWSRRTKRKKCDDDQKSPGRPRLNPNTTYFVKTNKCSHLTRFFFLTAS